MEDHPLANGFVERPAIGRRKETAHFYLGDGWAPAGLHVKQRSRRPGVDICGSGYCENVE